MKRILRQNACIVKLKTTGRLNACSLLDHNRDEEFHQSGISLIGLWGTRPWWSSIRKIVKHCTTHDGLRWTSHITQSYQSQRADSASQAHCKIFVGASLSLNNPLSLSLSAEPNQIKPSRLPAARSPLSVSLRPRAFARQRGPPLLACAVRRRARA